MLNFFKKSVLRSRWLWKFILTNFQFGFILFGSTFTSGCTSGILRPDDLVECFEPVSAQSQSVENDENGAAVRQNYLSRKNFLESIDDQHTMAQTQFPLPRAEFDVQIEWFARVVEAKLRFHDSVCWPNGSKDDGQVERILRFVCSWQNPAFVESLLVLLRERTEYRYYLLSAGSFLDFSEFISL